MGTGIHALVKMFGQTLEASSDDRIFGDESFKLSEISDDSF